MKFFSKRGIKEDKTQVDNSLNTSYLVRGRSRCSENSFNIPSNKSNSDIEDQLLPAILLEAGELHTDSSKSTARSLSHDCPQSGLINSTATYDSCNDTSIPPMLKEEKSLSYGNPLFKQPQISEEIQSTDTSMLRKLHVLESVASSRTHEKLMAQKISSNQHEIIETACSWTPGSSDTGLEELFCYKLKLCCTSFDKIQIASEAWHELKRKTLLELIEFVNNNHIIYRDDMIQNLFEMVVFNIFRPIPIGCKQQEAHINIYHDYEEDTFVFDADWPHLQMVYELLLRFLVSADLDMRTVKKYIDREFVAKFLTLFSSKDPREQDYLKTILHRIYGKMMTLRSYIREAIHNLFLAHIYEHERHEGVAELLEILGSIINGFALPLKLEHKAFLEKALIPLHKSRNIIAFHQQLTYCMTQYVEKDHCLAVPIIKGLLKFWPVTNTHKEILFLNEVEESLLSPLNSPP